MKETERLPYFRMIVAAIWKMNYFTDVETDEDNEDSDS